MKPGAIALTWMLRSRRSRAQTLVNMWIADFVAQYTDDSGKPSLPKMTRC